MNVEELFNRLEEDVRKRYDESGSSVDAAMSGVDPYFLDLQNSMQFVCSMLETARAFEMVPNDAPKETLLDGTTVEWNSALLDETILEFEEARAQLDDLVQRATAYQHDVKEGTSSSQTVPVIPEPTPAQGPTPVPAVAASTQLPLEQPLLETGGLFELAAGLGFMDATKTIALPALLGLLRGKLSTTKSTFYDGFIPDSFPTLDDALVKLPSSFANLGFFFEFILYHCMGISVRKRSGIKKISHLFVTILAFAGFVGYSRFMPLSAFHAKFEMTIQSFLPEGLEKFQIMKCALTSAGKSDKDPASYECDKSTTDELLRTLTVKMNDWASEQRGTTLWELYKGDRYSQFLSEHVPLKLKREVNLPQEQKQRNAKRSLYIRNRIVMETRNPAGRQFETTLGDVPLADILEEAFGDVVDAKKTEQVLYLRAYLQSWITEIRASENPNEASLNSENMTKGIRNYIFQELKEGRIKNTDMRMAVESYRTLKDTPTDNREASFNTRTVVVSTALYLIADIFFTRMTYNHHARFMMLQYLETNSSAVNSLERDVDKLLNCSAKNAEMAFYGLQIPANEGHQQLRGPPPGFTKLPNQVDIKPEYKVKRRVDYDPNTQRYVRRDPITRLTNRNCQFVALDFGNDVNLVHKLFTRLQNTIGNGKDYVPRHVPEAGSLEQVIDKSKLANKLSEAMPLMKLLQTTKNQILERLGHNQRLAFLVAGKEYELVQLEPVTLDTYRADPGQGNKAPVLPEFRLDGTPSYVDVITQPNANSGYMRWLSGEWDEDKQRLLNYMYEGHPEDCRDDNLRTVLPRQNEPRAKSPKRPARSPPRRTAAGQATAAPNHKSVVDEVFQNHVARANARR